MFGSAIAGAEASITNTAARTTRNINQNQQTGNAINSAQNRYAAGGTLTALGGGIAQIGGSLYSGSETLGDLYTQYTTPKPT